ncbi:MAG: AAA family ATPase [Desulfurococcaceae archaeon TW002]
MKTRILGVRLRNIRSYVDKIIVFPPSGTTVIYGDNGTGKTSILLGINYALFGLPRGQKSSDPFIGFVSPYKDDLLRAGASSAMVKILVKHRDKLILIERKLNGDRSGRIMIFSITDGTPKLESSSSYSSEDLTEKILEVLSLREDPRKSRSTYIFSNVMYVPQFNIHQTLILDDKQRRELVDRVLGLDKYMTALNNIEKIAKGKNSVIGSELYNIDKIIEDRRKTLEKINVNEVRTKLSELKSKRDELSNKLIELRARREFLEAEKEKLSSRMNELSLKIGELRNKIKVINDRERELKSKKEGLNKILSEVGLSSIGSVNDLIKELQARKLGLEEEYSRVSENLKQLDEKLRSIEDEEMKTLAHVSKLETKIESIKNRVKEIWSEVIETKNVVAQGVCPLCRQSITREYGEKLVRNKYAGMREIATEIVPLIKELWAEKLLQLRLSNEKEKITKMKSELSEYQNKILEKLRSVEATIPKLNRVAELHEEISMLEREVLEKARVSKELSSAEEELRKLSERVNDLKTRLSEITKEEVTYSKELGEVSKQIENLERDLERYSELSNELRKLELRASILTKVRDYLLNHIYKGVETIENAARSLAHERFSEYFQEYFTKLLENQELIEASVSDFKPSLKVRADVTRGHEISQPSGAQLTALGLAYRLALNKVVRDFNIELRDSVLIMDEPTLGFSPERVEKLRELIESIGSSLGKAQVILVTHDERLLEVGDCKIRLSINQLRNETLVNYEECLVGEENTDFQEYMNFVYNILSK